MAPTPENPVIGETRITRPLSGKEVVISGMSGIFPCSDSVLEFSENLYNKVDMVTAEESRWIVNHPEVPKHLGQVKGMNKFDSQFFRVHYKQACAMEPMSRKLLEHTYSAIYDSGINPLQLRGKKVGVFIGSTFSESERTYIYSNILRNGFGVTGCNKAMYSNRISYWIDGKGPSYSLDVACASSTACLEHAFRAITDGQCDAAIIGGCNLCMHPNISLNFTRAGFLCSDGKTKCFDKNGDGYVRSDAVSVLFLQRAEDANRIYSEVYHTKSIFGTSIKEQFLPIRTPREIQDFLDAFYSEIDVSPEEVEYVEGCGAAIAEADSNEITAIGEVFAKQKPIKVGCVKSNMGCSEPASGICALTKLCLAYHKGELPANLHYYEPMSDIPVVTNNMVQVLTENAKFNRGFCALNTFSYSGCNVHILLKGHFKPKDIDRYKSSIPYLVLASGRQDFCVQKIFKVLNSSKIDPEQIGMLHNIHNYDISGHMCRGYTILDTNEKKETVCLSQSIEYCLNSIRPIWFVYSGMGSQWAGMGADLMRIPTFSAVVEKCRRVLEPKGVDIIRILTEPDKTIFDNILNCFVGIAAIQIGLTDILREMGIVPDNIIGHSVGELGCAYADGCFTAEEMILSAYSRGLVSLETPFIRGSMAAVGLGYEKIIDLCPPEIEVACHNSSESSTISGPVDVMKAFVSELTSKGIFAKEVPCSNIAYHSKYIASAGPGLLKYLSEVIVDPKPRSEKWVSTSVPEDNWNDLSAKYSSAEYHTNNLLNPVLFEETARLIPSDAVLIEIAPHGLLQAILKRSLSECLHVPLTRRSHAEPVIFFLEAIGKLYEAGHNPQVGVLYPKIEYPVSTETPLLSHLVEWEHSEDWPQATYNSKDRVVAIEREFVTSIHDDDFSYLVGHVRDGVCVFPEAAYLVIIWETLAMFKGIADRNSLSVAFYDIEFHSEVTISDNMPLKLQIMILKGNNRFEISYENSAIVSGTIVAITSKDISSRTMENQEDDSHEITLTTEDIYTMMNLRGFSYKNKFQSIQWINSRRNKAGVKWTNEWIPFLDSLIQANAFARDHDGISTPKLIKKLIIDVESHRKEVSISNDLLEANLYQIYDCSTCGGVEINGLIFTDKPTSEQEPDVLQTLSFVPHQVTGSVTLHTALQVNLQIVLENVSNTTINIGEAFSVPAPEISAAIKKASFEIGTADFINTNTGIDKIDPKLNVLVVDNLLADEKKMRVLAKNLPDDAFILTFEEHATEMPSEHNFFNIITSMSVQNQTLILMKKVLPSDDNLSYINIAHEDQFTWVPQIRNELELGNRVVLVSQRQPYCGLIGLVKKLNRMFDNKLSLILVDDFCYVSRSSESQDESFKKQLKKNLAINIMKKGMWGGYYFLTNNNKVTKPHNVELVSGIPGDLTSLSWIESTNSFGVNPIKVCYSGVSVEDTQYATGKIIKNNKAFGMDFSGIDKSGRRVMGLVSGGSLANVVKADSDLLWPIPDHWTLEDAATVPLPYVYAYYCLTMKVNIDKGKSIFVNGADEAIGQAIISLAFALDFDVYATVSDLQKKEFLLKLFPLLQENHIYSLTGMKNFSFASDITCDVVVNVTSGPCRKALFKIVTNPGIVFDLCEYDTSVTDSFGMSSLNHITHYILTNLSAIFLPEYAEDKKLLQQRVATGIATGVVKPLNRVVYSPVEVIRAFRLLSTNRQKGKVMIRMEEPENLKSCLKVIPRTTYSADGTYVIVCNESPLGIELIDRLVKKGAKKLVIHLKSTTIAGYSYIKFASLKKNNVTIKIITNDVHTQAGCKNILAEGKKLGPILGIFIIQDFTTTSTEDRFEPDYVASVFNKAVGTVANFDIISRNMCSELTHFVVLNYSSKTFIDEYVSSATDKICQGRCEITLPALILRIGQINEFNPRNENLPSKIKPQTLPAVFNVLESCLKLKYNNVVAFNLYKNDEMFLNKISEIIGLKNIDAVPETYSLPELSLNDFSISEIQKAILETYKVSYTLEALKKITIKGLKNISRNIIKPNTCFDSGFGAFYTYIDDDECLASELHITMDNVFKNVQEIEELDPQDTYLLLIPGFEGHHQIFHSVCERLKIKSLTLQLTPDLTNDSIQAMAKVFMKFMKKQMELKSKFYLLGYSFGVNVALELAHLIETEGHVGVVYCLDSSPEALRAQLRAYIGDITEDELQNIIVKHIFKLMSGKDVEELNNELQSKENWPDKVELCVNKLKGIVKYSQQYVRSVLEGAYYRIMLARAYEPDFKLESELVLMRGIPHPMITGLSYDYNLSKYSTKPVKVYHLESDHALAPYDCRVANIVNKYLEPKLIEEFNGKCLLETYLADPYRG
ncbi:hypothetical protein K1T71_008129 [Dendrolimus kikuchii]|uniref:Uncharacterized protein n=1 Tax=Dendrolimus kikuchii TaxID=765133 RepID=A0ACC1CWV9_9NEOP|nr:hypothetical protein K1T71_008129 [Dendrolimus kikuchii]